LLRWQALAGSGLQTFKTKAFARFANREGLEDDALCDATSWRLSGCWQTNTFRWTKPASPQRRGLERLSR